MEVEVEERDERTSVLKVSGRVDLVSAGRLRRVVEEAIDGGRRSLVVDLGEVPFVDSSGVGALVGALKLTRQVGGELRIAAVAPTVRDVLRLTTVDRILRPYDTVDEALEGL